MPIDPHVLVPVLVFCYIGWRLYRRIRRHIGRQTVQTGRMIYRIVIYSVIVVMIGLSAALRNPLVLTGLAGGLVLGAALAFVGLRLTEFETTSEGQFYTPNTYIGVGLAVLLVARIAYRLIVFYNVSQGGPPPGSASANLGQSPLTLLFFGLLFGYYVAYYAGVLARAGKMKAATVGTPAQ